MVLHAVTAPPFPWTGIIGTVAAAQCYVFLAFHAATSGETGRHCIGPCQVNAHAPAGQCGGIETRPRGRATLLPFVEPSRSGSRVGSFCSEGGQRLLMDCHARRREFIHRVSGEPASSFQRKEAVARLSLSSSAAVCCQTLPEPTPTRLRSRGKKSTSSWVGAASRAEVIMCTRPPAYRRMGAVRRLNCEYFR